MNQFSPDGWYSTANEVLGDMYATRGMPDDVHKAEKQYRLALDGYIQKAKRTSTLGDARIAVPQAHEARITALKKKVASVGGNIDVSASEVGDWQQRTPSSPQAENKSAVSGQDLPKGTSKGMTTPFERELKSLPEIEARRLCLEQVQKLGEDPGANPEQLEFCMRGLGRPFDPPEAKALRQVLMMTKNDKLRAAAIRQLSKWITDDADSRQTVIKDLSERLQNPDRQVRQDALVAIGQGGDLCQLKKVAPLLDDADAQVRETALKAVTDLLGWTLPKSTDAAMVQQQVAQAKQAVQTALRALEDAEHLAGPQKPQ